MANEIDLNADLGEGTTTDAQIMPLISSCSIACGGHTGTITSMATALDLAKRHKVQAGAHPAYPDREGFGRRPLEIALDELGASIANQVANLAEIAASKQMRLHHLKPHGALYHVAADNRALAELLVVCTAALGPEAQLVGPPDSELEDAATRAGQRYVAEGFIDRAYLATGRLVPREHPGAVLADTETRLNQALMLVNHAEVTTIEGRRLTFPVETLCLHGDSEGALETAKAVRARFDRDKIRVRPPK